MRCAAKTGDVKAERPHRIDRGSGVPTTVAVGSESDGMGELPDGAHRKAGVGADSSHTDAGEMGRAFGGRAPVRPNFQISDGNVVIEKSRCPTNSPAAYGCFDIRNYPHRQ